MRNVIVLIILLLAVYKSSGQVEEKRSPRSFEMTLLSRDAKNLIDLPSQNNSSLRRQADEKLKECATCKTDYYGKTIKFEIDFFQRAEISRVPNGNIYRLKLRSRSSKGLQFQFDQFYIPSGGELYFYTEDRKYVYGAYTDLNNQESKKFMTRILPGNEIIIEFFEPLGTSGAQLNIINFVHVFEEFRQEKLKDLGYGASGSCMVNVACNSAYALVSQSVARWSFEGDNGFYGFCTGSLINNGGNIKKPYFISAGHCMGNHTVNSFHDNIIFYFNYESETCENPIVEPIFGDVQTFQGAHLRSYEFTANGLFEPPYTYPTDYVLLEMNDIPEYYTDVAYLGWDRRDQIPSYAVNVSHPKGDIKKGAWTDNIISLDSKSESLENCHNKEVEAHVFELEWNSGRTANNSSGSPLVDENGRLVGVLEGGLSNCSDSQTANICGDYDVRGPDWFSELSYMWDHPRGSFPTLQSLLSWDNPNRETMDVYNPPDPHPDGSGWYENPCERDFGDGMSINYDEDSQVACVDGVIVMRPKKAQDDACWGAANPYWEIYTEDTDYSCNSIPSGVNDDLCSRRLLVPWKCRCYFAKYHITLTETNSSGTPIGPSYTKWFSVQSSDIKQRFYEISLTPQDAIDMGTQLKSGSYYVIRLKKEGSLSDVRIFRYMNQSTTIDYNPSQNVIANYKIEVENTTITNAVNIVARNSVKIKSGSVLKAGKYVSDFEMDCDRRSTFNLSRTIAGENMKNYTIPRPDEDELLEELEQSYSMLPSVSNTGLFQLHMTNSEICEVGVYDINGRLITRGVRVSDNDILIDVSSSQKGMFVVVIDGESSKSSRKIIYN